MQAARGTSLTPGDIDAGQPARTPMRRRRAWWIFVSVALSLYAVDIITKVIAVDRLSGRPDVQVVGEVLQLRLVRNPGAAFSTGTGFTPALTVVAIVAALTVLWFSRRLGSLGWAVGLGFLMAGITGNLTDRLARDPGAFHGHVVDFLMLPNWPIFNVADICINIAAVLIVLMSFRGVRLDGTRDTEATDSTEDVETDPADAASADRADTTDRTGTADAADTADAVVTRDERESST